MDISAIRKARDKVLRREQLLLEAVREFDEITTEQIERAEIAVKSRRLKTSEIATLLDMHRVHVYRIGAADCKTYLELWQWVKKHRPDLLDTLEKNYDRAG